MSPHFLTYLDKSKMSIPSLLTETSWMHLQNLFTFEIDRFLEELYTGVHTNKMRKTTYMCRQHTFLVPLCKCCSEKLICSGGTASCYYKLQRENLTTCSYKNSFWLCVCFKDSYRFDGKGCENKVNTCTIAASVMSLVTGLFCSWWMQQQRKGLLYGSNSSSDWIKSNCSEHETGTKLFWGIKMEWKNHAS